MTALYESFGLLITRMETLSSFNEPLVDEDGRSLLPPSLIALALGSTTPTPTELQGEQSMFRAVDAYQRHAMSRRGYDETKRRDDFARLMASDECRWPFCPAISRLDQMIPIACLYEGLRFLQLSTSSRRPLLAHSLPSSLLYIQFDHQHQQKVDAWELPESVRHVAVCWETDVPGLIPVRRYGCRDLVELRRRLDGKEVRVPGCRWSAGGNGSACDCSYHRNPLSVLMLQSLMEDLKELRAMCAPLWQSLSG